jgi:hypothetical protein
MSVPSSGVEDENSNSDSETDVESCRVPPLTRLYKKQKKVSAKKVPANQTVTFITCVHFSTTLDCGTSYVETYYKNNT